MARSRLRPARSPRQPLDLAHDQGGRSWSQDAGAETTSGKRREFSLALTTETYGEASTVNTSMFCLMVEAIVRSGCPARTAWRAALSVAMPALSQIQVEKRGFCILAD